MSTIWNSVFNLLWTGSFIMAWDFERTGEFRDPFRFFSKRVGGKCGMVKWGPLTQVFQGDDTVAFYTPEFADFYNWLGK